MYLLKNLNEHSHPNGYSIGCWGYIQDGREYAIIGCNGGTAFIDVTDSANIHEVDIVIGPFSNWRDIKTYQHWAYITNDVSGGIQIVDLQYLPDSVHLVGTYSFSGFVRAHTLQQSGPYLYVNGGSFAIGGVIVLDLSVNPEVPVRRGQWELMYVHDERVVNDTLYTCNIYTGRITILDATNKDSLKPITFWMNGQNPMPHNCALTDDGNYLFTTDEILIPGPGKLKLWNIEDIFNPVFVNTWSPVGGDSSNVHNIEIYGNLAVICHYTAGIRILDISNPVVPVEIAWYDTYPQHNGTTWDGCKGIYMFPSGKIIANDKQTGFYCVKIGASIGIDPNGNEVPVEYSLKQNYPNPFNPVTNIEFVIPKNDNVEIKMYDVSGNEVKTLFKGYTRAGANKLTFDAGNFSSGVYFYKMMVGSGDFEETRKMILLK